MTVFVNNGLGFFSGKWIKLSSSISFDVVPINSNYRRIDIIVIRLDLSNQTCGIIYRTGALSSDPVEPSIIFNDNIKEYPIAVIRVYPYITHIHENDIIDLRGKSICPWAETLLSTKIKIVNVTRYGVSNDGSRTEISNVLSSSESNVIYFFPKGTYRIKGFVFSNCDNINIFAPNASFQHFTENNQSRQEFFRFENCSYCKVIGGKYDGQDADGAPRVGINFVNSTFSIVRDVIIQNIGDQNKEMTSGISFTGECDNSIVENVIIDNVQVGIISSDGFYHVTGIAIRDYIPADEPIYLYNKNIMLKNVFISNIGTVSNNTDIDGDGIYIVQFPKSNPTMSVAESYIKIVNPTITACSKRAIKVATRCVDIIGGMIDVSCQSAAVEYQYVRNSSIRDLHVCNQAMTAITICGGDGLISIENCYIYGNGTGNGIVLSKGNICDSGENVCISKCDFENLYIPICAHLTSYSEAKVNSDSIIIKECSFGHFKGSAAILMLPSRFASLKKLKISDISFKFGQSFAEIFNSNNAFYCDNVSNTCIIDLGTPSDFLDPSMSLMIDIDSIKDDFDELFKLYPFQAKNLYLSSEPASASYVYEYPELINIISSDTIYGSTFSINLTSSNSLSINGATSNVSQRVFISISDIKFESNIVYSISVSANSFPISNILSVGLFRENNNQTGIGDEIMINKDKNKISFMLDSTQLGKYLSIKLFATAESVTINTEITLNVTRRTPYTKGVFELTREIDSLKARIEALEALSYIT